MSRRAYTALTKWRNRRNYLSDEIKRTTLVAQMAPKKKTGASDRLVELEAEYAMTCAKIKEWEKRI
jgi:hypothetical protein